MTASNRGKVRSFTGALLLLYCATASAQATFSYRVAVPRLAVSASTPPVVLVPPTLSATELTFGERLLMSESRQTLTLNNPNPQEIALVGAPALTGSNAFSLTSNGCGTTLPANSQCEVEIAFRPTTSGQAQASLSFETSSGAASVPLNGTGAGELSLYLKFDGTPGSTSIVDEAGGAVTNYEGVSLTDTSFVSGNGSGQFSGYRRLTVSAPNKFNFNEIPFTAEVWFKPTSATALQGLLGTFQLSQSGWRLITNNSAGLNLLLGKSSGYVDYNTNPGIITANKWNHAAVVGNGSTVTLYANGVAQLTVTQEKGLNTSGLMYVGVNSDQSSGVTWRFNGQLDEVRVVKGLALYTSNFTPVAPAKP